MPNLNRLAYFAAVVEAGSFTAAAERLGVTKAVVSQQVARLEREFHAALLVRSTRRVHTTEAGQAFYQRCAVILKEADSAFGELAEHVDEPAGTLLLTAPFDLGIGVVVRTIAAFGARYPRCKVEARFSDKSLDVASGEVDLAIRVGWLRDAHLQARRICAFQQWLVAPSAWRARVQALTHPGQIAELPFVANRALRDPTRWTFAHASGDQETVQVQPGIAIDATLGVREAVVAGAGLSVLPDFAVADDVEADRLVRVLPAWQLPSGDISAVFPGTRFRPAKVRAFVDMLAETMRKE